MIDLHNSQQRRK